MHTYTILHNYFKITAMNNCKATHILLKTVGLFRLLYGNADSN